MADSDSLLGMVYNTGPKEGAAPSTTVVPDTGGSTSPQATPAPPAPTPSSAAAPPSGPVPVAPPQVSDGPQNQTSGVLGKIESAAGFIGDVAGMGKTLPDYGIDSAYMDKMQRTRDFAEKLRKLQNLSPDQQATILKSAGLGPEDLPGIIQATGANLKEQQQQMGQVSAQAGAEGERVSKEAQSSEYFNKVGATLATIGMIGLGPAAAVTYGGITGASAIMAEIAKSYIIFQAAGLTGSLATKAVHKIYPNAGPYTDFAVSLVGSLFGGVATGAALEPGGASWLQSATRENPAVGAAVHDTNHTYSEPVGFKDPLEDFIVTAESKARDAKVAQLKTAAAQLQEPTEGVIPKPPEGTAKMPEPEGAVPPAAPVTGEAAKPAEAGKIEPELEQELAKIDEEEGRAAKPLPPGEVPEHLKAEAPDEGPTTARGAKYEDRGPIQHIRDTLGKSIWEILKKNPRGSISTRELTEEQLDAIRSSFGEWAIPIISAAQKAGDTETLDKFSGLLKPQDEKAFNIPPPEPKLVSAQDRAAKTREVEPEVEPAVAAKPAGEEPPTEEPAEPAEPAAPTKKPGVIARVRGRMDARKEALAAAYKALVQAQGEMADRLGLIDNTDAVNDAFKRKSGVPVSDEDMARYNTAATQSIDNIQKLAAEHLDAAAHDDNARVGLIGDLFQNETAKLAYLQKATGESTEDVAQKVANATSQSSDILRIVGSEKGTKAELQGKTAAVMGWQKYLDPANIAVAETLWHAPLWAAKAMIDATWLTSQNFLKGLSYLPSAHPEDAILMWGGSLHGVMESIGDAVRYGGEAFKFGGRSAEINLGMMKGENNTSTTLFDDYSDTNAGEAIQYLTDVYSNGVAGQIKRVAGMALNAGPKVILAEDQFAKTFAFRAAARTAAVARASAEASEKGLKWSDHWEFTKAQAEQYVNDMPDWLVKQASDEAYQHTFTSYNALASKVQQALNLGTIPASRWSPEMHLGRLFGGLYVTTPMNMMKEGFLNSPLAFIMPKSSGMYAGGASTRLALTKVAAGTAMMVYLYNHAGQFHLTGSGDSLLPEQRRMRAELGIPNFSIGVGNTYISYERGGPWSIPLQFAANMAEIHGAASAANKGAYFSQAIAAFAQTLNHGPLMHMFPNIFHALANAGMGNTDEIQQFVTEAASTIIRPTIVKQITQALDPVMRQATDNVQRLVMDSPFYRANIPLKRDHWGNPQYVPPSYEGDEIPPNPLQAWLYVFSPLRQRPIPHIDDVDAEAMRVGADFKPVDKMFIGSAGPTGLRADPNDPRVGVPYHPTDTVEDARLKDRLEVLTGHETTIRGMNQHDYMRQEINSDYYKSHDTPNHVWQKTRLEHIHEMFYAQARQQLMNEPNGLRERVGQRTAERRQELMGTRSGGGTSIGAP